ncbi:MAG: transposase [Thiotrichaceae bacterium]|nr:transposase [Thiotrichaceae bacterium]
MPLSSVLHERIANARLDFLHKTSTHISKNHAMVVVENLKVRNMSKSVLNANTPKTLT